MNKSSTKSKAPAKEPPKAENTESSPVAFITADGKTYDLIDIIPSNGRVKETAFTIDEICRRIEEGVICRDALLQRLDNQWNNSKKSYLILSALYERPLGTIIITGRGMTDNKLYEKQSLLDGLQRTTALWHFIRDKFRLVKDLPPVMCSFKSKDGEVITRAVNVSGLKFSELPAMFQQRIRDTKIDVNIYNGFTDSELDNIVFCVNNGTPFKPMQKLRTIIGSEMMKHIQPVCDCTFWEKTPKITAKNDNILGCVIRTLMLYTKCSDNGLSVSEMEKFAKGFKAGNKANTEAVEDVGTLFRLFDSTIHKAIKGYDEDYKFLTTCTIPHFLMNFDKFQKAVTEDDALKNADYTAFLNEFLSDSEYIKLTNHCHSGSGGGMYSSKMVEDRQYIIDNALDSYIDDIKFSQSNPNINQ